MPEGRPTIRNHIRRLRFESGELSQEELGKRCGVTRHTIMALEAGKYSPSLLLAFRIARAFGTGVEQVFEYGDIGNPGRPVS
ncbi:MAG TPA: helix-turn-helix transcriptional regulator [Candidatus Acidoferrales bacterium]|jgi:putative transcriptional regulator|nr:helix-turn-helix transcriptional regulator [Candidatus Acidoferrales bacterium]